MAVNHVDGLLFISIFGYPIMAGRAAINAGARWTVILFVAASVPFGCAVIYVGRTIIYWIGGKFIPHAEKRSVFYQWVVGTPMFALYLIWPLAVTRAARRAQQQPREDLPIFFSGRDRSPR
jgi:hypothetical protein